MHAELSSSRGLCAPADVVGAYDEVVLDPALSRNNFSNLLWMPHDQHKVSRINDDVSYGINYIIFIFIK